MRMSSRLYAWLISLSFVTCAVSAHESHDTRVQRLDTQLDQLDSGASSESLALMLRRADLYRRQNHWDAALHDYQRVAAIDPQNIAMMFGMAKLHLDRRQYAESLKWSSKVLSLQPEHALAELQYARALAGNGDSVAASAAFENAIKRLAKPRPEHYIEHAHALLADNHNPDAKSKAIAILDKGAEALGEPISLHSLSFELERNLGQLAAALSRIDNVLARNDSLLRWRLQRGEVLVELERHGEALSELHCVIQNIQKLPEQRRLSRAFQSMIGRSKELVAQINAASAASDNLNKASLAIEC